MSVKRAVKMVELTRWEPLRGVNALQERINRLFDEAFAAGHASEDDRVVCAWKPVVDMYQEGDSVFIKAELPGVLREDVTLEVTDNVLTLKGTRPADYDEAAVSFYRQERGFGSFHRSFTLPDRINPQNVKAHFKDGLLVIRIHCEAHETLRKVAIDIQ